MTAAATTTTMPTTRLAPLLALLLIYALVLGAILLGFRGTERSVGVSLRRAEEGIRASRALSLSLPPAAPGDPASAPSPALPLPPLDAALQDAAGGLGEGARPGWEDAEAGAGEVGTAAQAMGAGMGYGDGDFAETLSDPFAPAPAPRRRTPSLLDGLDAALDAPSVRRVPPREAAQAQWARQQAKREEALEWVRERARADAAAEAARRASGTPSRAARSPAPAPTPRAFTPEARLMLPDSFSAPAAAPGPARTAKTIYPSEDATYGAAEFDVVSSPQQRHEGPEAARFSMTPEERILAAHVRGGGG
jgi:hypothetical protein